MKNLQDKINNLKTRIELISKAQEEFRKDLLYSRDIRDDADARRISKLIKTGERMLNDYRLELVELIAEKEFNEINEICC